MDLYHICNSIHGFRAIKNYVLHYTMAVTMLISDKSFESKLFKICRGAKIYSCKMLLIKWPRTTHRPIILFVIYYLLWLKFYIQQLMKTNNIFEGDIDNVRNCGFHDTSCYLRWLSSNIGIGQHKKKLYRISSLYYSSASASQEYTHKLTQLKYTLELLKRYFFLLLQLPRTLVTCFLVLVYFFEVL